MWLRCCCSRDGSTWLSFNRQRDSSYVPGAEGNPARVVAVLPFSNLSANPDNAVLGASISNEVINLLGRSPRTAWA